MKFAKLYIARSCARFSFISPLLFCWVCCGGLGNGLSVPLVVGVEAELYPSMILGACQATIFERTLAWDHAAGILLLEEAGGHCARLDGTSYRTDDDRVGLLAATSERNWNEVAERLRDLPE